MYASNMHEVCFKKASSILLVCLKYALSMIQESLVDLLVDLLLDLLVALFFGHAGVVSGEV